MIAQALPIGIREAAVAASPVLAVLAAAAGAVIAGAFSRGRESLVARALALAGPAAALLLAWRLWPQLQAAQLATAALDRLSLGAIMIISVAVIFATLISPESLRRRQEGRAGYDVLTALAAAAMALLVTSADLIAILIAFESMALCLYALTAFTRERPASVEAALKYFVLGAFATAFLCMGIAFIFGAIGSTDLTAIAARAGYVSSQDGRFFFRFGMAMLMAGLAFKVAAVPFHSWAPDAYDGAPTSATMLMATAAKIAAFIALLRVGLSLCAPGGALWHDLTWGIAAATILWGNLAALRQTSLKRLLAYSSIAQAGTMLIALPSLSLLPVTLSRALLLYLVAYALATGGAFAVAAVLGVRRGEVVELKHLAGLLRQQPLLAVALSIFLISLAGFPPLLGFFAKYDLFMAAVSAGDLVLVGIALAGTLISVAYYLRPVVAMCAREPRGPAAEVAPIPIAAAAVIALAALALLVFGVLPGNLMAFVSASAY